MIVAEPRTQIIVMGDQVPLAQELAPPYALLVTVAPGVSIVIDVSDRPGRQLGIVYGNQAQLQQVPGTLELITQDTGLHTNPERWMHDNHWDSGAELVLNAAAAVNFGAAVGAGVTRRIRSITVRNTALVNTVITLSQLLPLQNRVSFDVPAQTTRVWSEQDAVQFLAGVQVQISSSAAAAGAETYIHASGVEA